MARVMIVDDEVEMTRLLKMLLELEGFTVDTSPAGKTAMEKAAVAAPDVFMVDYHLQDMSGEELIRQIRAVDALAKTPIVVASGRDVEPEVKRAGATEFMLKPFEPDALIDTLKRLSTSMPATPAETASAQPTAAAAPEPAPSVDGAAAQAAAASAEATTPPVSPETPPVVPPPPPSET